MRKVMAIVVGLVLVSSVATFAACGSCIGDKSAVGSTNKACCKVMGTGVYVCPMDKIVAKESGKCAKCGMALVKMHVLSCVDGMVTLCPCKAKCKCTIKDGDAKCSCGNDVVKIAMKDMPACGACNAAASTPVVVKP